MKHVTNIALAAVMLSSVSSTALAAQAELNDLEMAHVAVTASNIDIAYAHLALAFSDHPEIRRFAQTMIRDHSAVNDQIAELAARLGVTARDNPMSRDLLAAAEAKKDELSRLRGEAFDRAYAANEAQYHQVVNGVVRNTFIPNIENAQVRQAFSGALEVFLVHQAHAERLQSLVEAR